MEAAAFYPVFRTEPPARFRIAVCSGEIVHTQGLRGSRGRHGQRELHVSDGESSADGTFSLETVPCRGLCSESPVVSVNERVFTVASADDLVAQLLRMKQNGH